MERRNVLILCDEVSEYWGDGAFYEPVITGLRKYGCSLVLLLQTLNQLPLSSVDVAMTCGHTISFMVGNKDARRLADEMLPPRLDEWKRSDGKYLHPADVRNLLIGDLMSLPQRHVIWKIRTVDGGELYMARVSDTM
jgi:hypothetical protein